MSEVQREFSPEERRRFAQADPEVLGLFFDLYFPRVYGYVRRLVMDEHLAEDLTQEIFVHVHRSLESYDPERELRPWVFTIATNKVRDFWRSRVHRNAQKDTSVERDGAADQLKDQGEQPWSGMADDELGERMRAAVEELPENLRMTVLLRVYEGLSFEEIGKIFDRNEVAVRKRYSRGLEALRASLGPYLRVHLEGT